MQYFSSEYKRQLATRRIIKAALMTATLMALCIGGLLSAWASSVPTKGDNSEVVVTEAQEVALQRVLVPVKRIELHTRLESNMFKMEEFPTNVVPLGLVKAMSFPQ